MRKRILSFILAVGALLVLTPDTVMAAKMEEKPLQIQETADSSSEMEEIGTETAPYRIKNAEQLQAFADMVNGVNGAPETGLCAVLTCNIDLSGVCGADIGSWTPIGTNANPYSGIFDGGSFAITGLYYHKSNSSYAGLFGNNAGIIKNLGVAGADVSAGSYTGGVCGFNSGIITSCYNAASVNGTDYTGGVCGYNNVGGTVSICYNMGAVSGRKYVGGICGYNKNTTADCYNMGTVYGKRTSIGGICGYNRALVSNCFNTGAVNGGGKNYIGSVCGYNHSQSSFLNCYYLITGEEKGNYGVGMTQEQFASGEVCWLLNDGRSENVVWRQTCGAGFPAFGGKVVYQARRPKTGGSADEMIVVYANEEEKKTAANNTSAEESDSEKTDGHVYQEPEWEWKEFSFAKAVFTCQDCGEKLSLEAVISKKTTKATCGKEGETVYTASVDRDGVTYTDKRTVKLKKPAHQPLEPVSPVEETCTEPGISQDCWTCPACGKYFENEDGKTELPRNKVVIRAKGHQYSLVDWEWDIENNPLAAAAIFSCSNSDCEETKKVKGTVKSKTTASCTEEGETVYTAVVTFKNKPYQKVETVSGKKIPHSYGKPKWEWAEDYTANAIFTCTYRCGTTETISAEITTKETDPTCVKAGKIEYTAVVTFGEKEHKCPDVKTKAVDKLPHSYSEPPKWQWATDFSTATATFTCDDCKKAMTKKATITPTTTPTESCRTPGKITYKAVVTLDDGTKREDAREKVIQPKHTPVLVPAVKPTCDNPGNKEHWKCIVCDSLFIDLAGKKPTNEASITIPAKGHTLKPVTEKIYTCTVCGGTFTVTTDSNGTTTMSSVEEDAVIPQDEAENSEETQEDTEPQSEDEQGGEAGQSEPEGQDGENDQSEPESRNGETDQAEPEGQNEQNMQSEQDGQSGQNEDESSDSIFEVPENAARYGLIYPEGEGEKADPVTAVEWEGSVINLRAESAGKTTPQTVREQQQQQGYPLWVSVTVLSALAGVLLVLLCKRKVIDDKRW